MSNEITGLAKGAWAILYEAFKGGDEVIFIDDTDHLYYGKLILLAGDERDVYFGLKQLSGKIDKYAWSEVRFMSHDGFPVRKLTGADGSNLIEKIDTKDIQTALREVTNYILCSRCGDKIHESKAITQRYKKYCEDCAMNLVFSDPFLVEGVNITIFNAGNCGLSWYGDHFEETTFLKAKDGSIGLLWEIPSIYYVGR
jgi:hypothetical protein